MESTCFDCASREFAHRIEKCARSHEDVTLFGVDYMPYPLDAEGEPIHVGDVMEWPDGNTFEVRGFGDNTLFYIDGDCCEWTSVGMKRHHHEPTVEDVLREFAEKMNENMGMYTGEAIDADEWRDADRQTIAEYAAKLRLAEDSSSLYEWERDER